MHATNDGGSAFGGNTFPDPDACARDAAVPVARLVAVLATAVLLLPTWGYGLGCDHAVLHYMAWEVLHGAWPYADYWDTSLPGALLIHVPAVWLGAESALSLRLLDFPIGLLAALLLFELGRRIEGPIAGVIAALTYTVAYVSGGYPDTAQRDSFIVPLLLAAVLLLWPRRRSLARMVAAGAALGLVCLIRPTYGLIAAAATTLVVAQEWRDRRAGAAGRVLGFIVPLMLPMLVFVGAYTISGRFESLRETTIFLATVYPEVDRKHPLHVVIRLMMDTPEVLWLGAALAVPVAIARPRRRPLLAVACLFALCMVIRLIEGKTYRNQFWPALAFVAVFAGVGWSGALRRLMPAMSARVALAWAVLIAALLPSLTSRPMLTAFTQLVPNLRAAVARGTAYDSLQPTSPMQAAVARYIREHTTDDDLLLGWGPGAEIYYAAKRHAASRFYVVQALLCIDEGGDPSTYKIVPYCVGEPSPVQDRWRRELLADVAARRPVYIVAGTEPGTLSVWDGQYFAPDFPELRALIAHDYRLETTIGPWGIYRRQPTAGSSRRNW